MINRGIYLIHLLTFLIPTEILLHSLPGCFAELFRGGADLGRVGSSLLPNRE